jgi:endoglucanase
MLREDIWRLGILVLGSSVRVMAGCAEGSDRAPGGSAVLRAADAGAGADTLAFVRRQGTALATGDGAPFRLQGVTFSSHYWGPNRDSIIHSLDHAAVDFTRVAALGMNSVQLLLSYRLLEDDSAPFTYQDEGWAWLDDNVRQARDNGLRVVLDLLLVAGGDWHDASSPSPDFRIWSDAELRRRFVELWRAIATHYADEPTVAAFGLLNEPVTTDAGGAGWWSLAEDAVAAIRSADSRHLIILNPLAGANGSYGVPTGVAERVLFDDPNLVYDVHFYEPADYVNQGAPWIPDAPADGGRYPDDTVVSATGSLEYVMGDDANPTLPAGDSDWALYEGAAYPVTDTRAVVAYPAMQCSSMTAAGTAWFDDFVVREYDAGGTFYRVVGEAHVTAANAGAWYPWSSDGKGVLAMDPAQGHADAFALSVSGDSANALFSTRLVMFMVTTGHAYQISGWAKGKNLDPGARCQFTLGFYRPGPDGTVTPRGRAELEALLTRRLEFGKAHAVPMMVSEFGSMRSCFDDGRGGLNWLTDMVSLLDEHQLDYVFFSYHSAYMGIYGDETKLPNPDSELVPITDFFRSHLAGQSSAAP